MNLLQQRRTIIQINPSQHHKQLGHTSTSQLTLNNHNSRLNITAPAAVYAKCDSIHQHWTLTCDCWDRGAVAASTERVHRTCDRREALQHIAFAQTPTADNPSTTCFRPTTLNSKLRKLTLINATQFRQDTLPNADRICDYIFITP